MSSLRSRLIRLAHQHPETRPHILPVLTRTASAPLRREVVKFLAAARAMEAAVTSMENVWDMETADGAPEFQSLWAAYHAAHLEHKRFALQAEAWMDAQELAEALENHVSVPPNWMPLLMTPQGRKTVEDALMRQRMDLQQDPSPAHDQDFLIADVDRALAVIRR